MVYGATADATDDGISGKSVEVNGNKPVQSFSIDETPDDIKPLTRSAMAKSRCCGGSGWTQDGLRMTVMCMFLFSLGVTIALVVQIALEPEDNTKDKANQVVTDNQPCGRLGEEVMEAGGNAVDAAVTATLCEALFEPHITGMGGGGMMLVHQHRTNQAVVVDFRETVPNSARNDRFIQNPNQAALGRTSVSVPGFLKGLTFAHDKYGSGIRGIDCCSWSNLVYKSIRYALQHGVDVQDSLANATQTKITEKQLNDPDAGYLKYEIFYFNKTGFKCRIFFSFQDLFATCQ